MNEVEKNLKNLYYCEACGEEHIVPSYEDIKSFIHSEIRRAFDSVVPEKLEEHEYDYCDNDFCFNDCIDQINSNIKEYLGGEDDTK